MYVVWYCLLFIFIKNASANYEGNKLLFNRKLQLSTNAIVQYVVDTKLYALFLCLLVILHADLIILF